MHEDYPIPLTPFLLRNTVLSFIFRPYVNRLYNNNYSEKVIRRWLILLNRPMNYKKVFPFLFDFSLVFMVLELCAHYKTMCSTKGFFEQILV